MVFEGRDAAGKGGTIGRFRMNLNPRSARVIALSKPSDVEASQWYFQRYISHLPAAGEMVFLTVLGTIVAWSNQYLGFVHQNKTNISLHKCNHLSRCY